LRHETKKVDKEGRISPYSETPIKLHSGQVSGMAIEWSILTDRQFESLCYDVLSRSGYKNVDWFGSGGDDRGRDIRCDRTDEILPGRDMRITCIAQCKRHVSQPPSVSDLTTTIAWADAHNPKRLFIMVSNILSANTNDWLDGIRPLKKYDIFVYDEKNFEAFFEANPDLYVKHFGREFPSPRNSVIASLLDMEYKATAEISTETGLPNDQVKSILDDLRARKVVSEGEPSCYRLEPTMASFLELSHRLLADEKRKVKFLTSQFSKAIMGRELMDYIQSRYHVALDEDRRSALAQLLRMSPSALDLILTAPTEIYDTGYAQVQEMALKDEDLQKWNESMLATLLADLLPRSIADLRSSGETIKKEKVEGYNVSIGLRAANSKASLLDIHCETTILSLPVRGPVRAGQLLSATDPDLHIKIGCILANMRLHEQAISSYDRAIVEIKDPKKLAEAWNNKGVSLWRLGKPEAIVCFEKALELDPSLT
jgi:tetratricopeptide (TPR) repeat protein